ncbi:MAG TPA: transcription termination/antitermination protein NusA [Candidatus Portnoybacteria bacterium]|nr:transcription termination/antitermination protein NusA [Candidatus Portnoybacteria bacterium]
MNSDILLNMNKKFLSIIKQIAEEKGLSEEKIIDIIEMAIAAAFRKDTGRKGQIIKVKFNPEDGEIEIYQIKIVVDKSMILEEDEEQDENSNIVTNVDELEEKKIKFNPEKHILVEDAQKLNLLDIGQGERDGQGKFNIWLLDENKAKGKNKSRKGKILVGDEIRFSLEKPENFGRIAAQTAKQVIIQRTREAEKDTILNMLESKIGKITSGIVQRFDQGNIILDLNPGVGIIPLEEQVFNERHRSGQRIRALVVSVNNDLRDPTAILSRNRGDFLKKIFELEVPEISSGIVKIKAIAREAGARSKIAVESTDEKIDPIGACIGQRGSRVQSITTELNGEKIDIIQWNENIAKFISNALAPAKITDIKIDEEEKKATVAVPDDQLSLAIGKRGQNVRLAVKLTGWKIDLFTNQGEKVETENIEKKEEEN